MTFIYVEFTFLLKKQLILILKYLITLNEITSFSAKGDVMLVGDFNARTGETNIYLILPRIIIMK
jgi:hypothetical protein